MRTNQRSLGLPESLTPARMLCQVQIRGDCQISAVQSRRPGMSCQEAWLFSPREGQVLEVPKLGHDSVRLCFSQRDVVALRRGEQVCTTLSPDRVMVHSPKCTPRIVLILGNEVQVPRLIFLFVCLRVTPRSSSGSLLALCSSINICGVQGTL